MATPGQTRLYRCTSYLEPDSPGLFHLHCLVPGGVLSDNRTTWTASKKNYLFKTRSLVKAFKGIYIKGLKELYEAGDLKFPGKTEKYGTSAGFNRLIKIIRKKKWSGYAKSPCSGQFIRRFLLHVLPKGFRKIRHFGFLSPRYKAQNIRLIRQLTQENIDALAHTEPDEESIEEMMQRLTGINIRTCPKCGKGRLARLLNCCRNILTIFCHIERSLFGILLEQKRCAIPLPSGAGQESLFFTSQDY